MTHPLIVTAAIIRKGDRVLITKRSNNSSSPGKWEFPGGKLAVNECPQQGLERELREELNLKASVDRIYDVIYHRYEWGPVLLLFYECSSGPNRIENIQVAEHRFVTVEELSHYDLLEADRPIVSRLQGEQSR
ncbi:MAG: (deoxy)nucleoside triphosphate pyrophosphohydrolase [Desulfuromonas sp.]|nr:MAG: (deoxy)nucleoside triphosphate pyrophosphohydrolase [Desulfuromonas sp.]